MNTQERKNVTGQLHNRISKVMHRRAEESGTELCKLDFGPVTFDVLGEARCVFAYEFADGIEHQQIGFIKIA